MFHIITSISRNLFFDRNSLHLVLQRVLGVARDVGHVHVRLDLDDFDLHSGLGFSLPGTNAVWTVYGLISSNGLILMVFTCIRHSGVGLTVQGCGILRASRFRVGYLSRQGLGCRV